ncbi:MAG: Crp/Fnr family transcriptional regulator [Pseudomonadota bacterium]
MNDPDDMKLQLIPKTGSAADTLPVGKGSKKSAEEFMADMPWFRALPAEAQRRVRSDSYETAHSRGEMFARSGEAVHSWLGVIEGLVKIQAVQRDGKVVAFTGVPAGSWFGEGSVIRRDARRYDVVTMRPTRLVHVPSPTFRWLLDVSLEFNHFIIGHLNERLAQNMSLVEIDRLNHPEAQLARVIHNLLNPVLYPNFGPFLPISQEEFGELAGLSRQRTNAAIKNLEKAGVLRVEYGGVFVEDLSNLMNFVHQQT